MRIFPPATDVGDEEGFSSEKDIFKRAEFGKSLANLVSIVEDPLVIVLDGPWGSGKTTFIKMWAGHLRSMGHPVIYFDAFANDYIDDAFIAIAGEVIAQSEKEKKGKTPAHKKFLNTAARAGRAILRSGTKIGVKAATLGALDAADIAELKSVAGDLASEASSKSDEYVKSLLSRQGSDRKSIEGFRSALSELVGSLGERLKAEDKAERQLPLIFIVDELDRCKPPFALELLEKIKHVFSVPNVHFVLVSHLAQVENSVRFGYGQDIDARTYLQKFYNLIVHLPGDGKYESERALRKFLEYLNNHLTFDRAAIEFIENVASAHNMTFRTVERMAVYLSLSIAFTTSNKQRWYRPPPILAGLCVLKAVEPNLFQKAKSGVLTFAEASSAFKFAEWPKESSAAERSIKWWEFALGQNIDAKTEEWRGFAHTLWDFNIEREDVVRVVANTVVDRMTIPQE